jgi:hypothetical protein
MRGDDNFTPTERTNVRTKIRMVAATAVGIAALGGQAGIADAASHKGKSATKRQAQTNQTNTAGSTPVGSDSGSTTVTDPSAGNKCGRGHGRHGGRRGGGGGRSETLLTGDTKTQAEAAAQAAYPDAKIWRSSTESPNDPSGAAYEVHLTKSDGSEIEVLEDKDFKVIATETSRQHARGDG